MAYVDLDRPPLSASALGRVTLPAPWCEVRLLDECDSTNAVVSEAARAGEPEGLVVVAEHQTAGRGRLDRQWVSPARSGLTLSMLLRPERADPWVLLLLAAACATAIGEHCSLDVGVKWPNDLLIGDRKVAGMLAEVVDGATVIGIGLNVSTRRDELPRDDATSLHLETGDTVDRLPLLLALLRVIGPAYLGWRDGADPRPAYVAACRTLGRQVSVTLPDATVVTGDAERIDAQGRLVVAGRALSAGDVIHVRGAG